jgi:short-subunit dehydrogenase
MTFAERYGPWAVIAGASEGTGRAFALELARAGLNCILFARRDAPLRALATEIETTTGRSCIATAVDLASPDACDLILNAVGSRDVGLYISNAGSDPNGAQFLEKDLSSWLELVNRNVLTTMRCSYHFGAAMRARGRGGIILVGSGACYGGGSNMAIYSATKAFDLCMGEGLWAEYRHYGVHVLNLILGRTDTPALRDLLARKGLPVPAGLASPEEVAQVGLAQLPFGPVYNWGLRDDETGYAPNSAATRRERILMVERMSQQIFGTKS